MVFVILPPNIATTKSIRLKGNCLALLTERGSLTDLMTYLMGRAPFLNCLTQGKAFATPIERQMLNIQPRAYAHIREITMGTKEHNWLFARTAIPLQTLRGAAKRLARMDKTPLGKILFGRSQAIRTSMQLELISSDTLNVAELKIPSDFLLWQRRSIFELNTGPLVISEVFLPDCPLYEE